nr:MAG TPA: hypothetical protein [Bacteriophage sp.]
MFSAFFLRNVSRFSLLVHAHVFHHYSIINI